jgi:hypothetical protein
MEQSGAFTKGFEWGAGIYAGVAIMSAILILLVILLMWLIGAELPKLFKRKPAPTPPATVRMM